MGLAVVHGRARVGIHAPPVKVEVHLAGGLPAMSIVGLPEAAGPDVLLFLGGHSPGWAIPVDHGGRNEELSVAEAGLLYPFKLCDHLLWNLDGQESVSARTLVDVERNVADPNARPPVSCSVRALAVPEAVGITASGAGVLW